MTTDSMDLMDLELRWLTLVDSGDENVLAIRSLANRISEGDIIRKESFILGFVASQATVETPDRTLTFDEAQLSLF